MYYYAHNSILMIVSILAILLLCPALQANSTIMITTAGYSYSYTVAGTQYNESNVGPYTATLNGTPNVLVYCLDMHISTPMNTSLDGYFTHPTSQAEDEAAFLAAWSLTQGAAGTGNNTTPTNTSIAYTVDGPVQNAIWQLLSTPGPNPADPAATTLIGTANTAGTAAYAYAHGQITQAFLNSIVIWNPTVANSQQRFMTLAPFATPEPGTVVFMATGVLLLALGRFRRKR